MKTKFSGLIAVAALAAAMASTASATELCNTVSDVTTIATAGGCTVAGSDLVFNNFTVSPSAGFTSATVGINGSGTQVVGDETDLTFQLGGIGGSGSYTDDGDIEILYTVTGGSSGVDISFEASPGPGDPGDVEVTEVACSAAFVGAATCPVGDVLANYSAISTGATVSESATFATTGTVYIKKDVTFNGGTTSEFTNSSLGSVVPEPMTFSLVGAGLLGLGFMGRRLRK